MKIIQYCIAQPYVNDEVSFESTINEMILEGWQPFGALSVAYDSHRDENILCQAMVKYEAK